jgi:hypothetical protein
VNGYELHFVIRIRVIVAAYGGLDVDALLDDIRKRMPRFVRRRSC